MKSLRNIVKSSDVSIGVKKELGHDYLNVSTNMNETESQSNNALNQRMLEIEEAIQMKLNDGNKQAQLIIREAYEDSKGIFQNAKSEGFDSGYMEGLEAGQNEAAKIIQEALAIKSQIQADKQTMVKELEHQIVSLVISSVEKILFTKLDESKDTVLGLIQRGIEKCTYTETLILRISPEDYEYVASEKDKILCFAENIHDINIRKDASLKKGSCILDTVSGSIDSSIQTQFDNLSQTFRELLGSG